MAAKYNILRTALYFITVLAASTSNESVEKTETGFKAQCLRNGGDFDKAWDAGKVYRQCINFNEIERGVIEGTKNVISMKPLLERYCSNSEFKKLMDCEKTYADQTENCYTPGDRKLVRNVHDEYVPKLLTKLCQAGERESFATYFSGSNYDCFQNKIKELDRCWEKTFEKFVDIAYNLHLSFDENQCEQLSILQECVVAAVKNCAVPDIINTGFNFLRKDVTPCKNFPYLQVNSGTSAAVKWSPSGLVMISATIIMVTMVTVLY